jgi:rubredoxin
MAGFIELDPEVVWKAIEGYQNELAPENTKLEAYYRQFRCPRCKGPCQKEYQADHAFADPDTAVARALLRCRLCECLFNPHVLGPAGDPMLVELGNIGKAADKP